MSSCAWFLAAASARPGSSFGGGAGAGRKGSAGAAVGAGSSSGYSQALKATPELAKTSSNPVLRTQHFPRVVDMPKAYRHVRVGDPHFRQCHRALFAARWKCWPRMQLQSLPLHRGACQSVGSGIGWWDPVMAGGAAKMARGSGFQSGIRAVSVRTHGGRCASLWPVWFSHGSLLQRRCDCSGRRKRFTFLRRKGVIGVRRDSDGLGGPVGTDRLAN